MFANSLYKRFIFAILLIVAFVFLSGCSASGVGQAPDSQSVSLTPAMPASGTPGNVSFAKDIQPILQNTCVSCHGGDRISRGLDMSTYDNLMKGSQNGAVVLAGNATKSLLVQSVETGAMPKRGAPLSSNQISLIIQWMNSGAKNN